MSDTHVAGPIGLPKMIPILNPLIRRLIGAGLPFGPNVLITIRGRRSGIPHTFPIAIIELYGQRYIQSPWGEVNWVRNLRAAGKAVLTKGRVQERVEAIELAPQEAAPILRDAVAPYLRWWLLRRLVRYFLHLGPESTPGDYLAEAERHPMFELRHRVGAAEL